MILLFHQLAVCEVFLLLFFDIQLEFEVIHFVIKSFHSVEASILYLFFECLNIKAAVLLAKQDLVEAIQLVLHLLVFLFSLFLHHFLEFAALFFPHLVPSL